MHLQSRSGRNNLDRRCRNDGLSFVVRGDSFSRFDIGNANPYRRRNKSRVGYEFVDNLLRGGYDR